MEGNVEGAHSEDAPTNPLVTGDDPDCEEKHDDPHTSKILPLQSDIPNSSEDDDDESFKHQLEALKRKQKACDSCLSNVRRAAKHCRTCDAFFCESHLADHDKAPASSSHETVTEEAARPPVNEGHLHFNPPAPAPMNTYSISWQWLMVILMVLLAVMIPMYSEKTAHARAAVQAERAQAKLEELRGCCQRMSQAVEEERARITQRMCLVQEEVESKRRFARRRLREQREMLLKVFQDEEMRPYAAVVLPLVDSTNDMLNKLLESHPHSQDEECLRSGLPKASTAQAS